MRRRRRDIAVFGLSFLDVISCGFGAAILLFMLVDHARIDRDLDSNFDLVTRVDALEEQVLDARQELLSQEAALRRDQDRTQTADAEAQRLREQIQTLLASMPQGQDSATEREAEIRRLQQELLALESRVQAMRAAAEDAGANATRTVRGEGQRQYLTGLSVGGRRVLILVDASASMLDPTIVGAIRRRNMDPATRRDAPKWRRTVETVNWITAQMPADGQFQLLLFAEDVRPATGSGGWLVRLDRELQLGEALTLSSGSLSAVTPLSGGGYLAAGREAADGAPLLLLVPQ